MNTINDELEKQIFMILKQKNNSSTFNSDELKSLTELYKTMNYSNYKKIEIPDLIPVVAWICITNILISFVITLL